MTTELCKGQGRYYPCECDKCLDFKLGACDGSEQYINEARAEGLLEDMAVERDLDIREMKRSEEDGK